MSLFTRVRTWIKPSNAGPPKLEPDHPNDAVQPGRYDALERGRYEMMTGNPDPALDGRPILSSHHSQGREQVADTGAQLEKDIDDHIDNIHQWNQEDTKKAGG